MFTGANGVRISGDARLTSVQNTYHVASSAELLDEGVQHLIEGIRLLTARVVAGAMHNSGERFDAPTCHEDTRVAVQDDILGWADELVDDLNDLVTWMYGPAGAGKSAIAQTIAQRLHSQGRLTASFFFSRASGSERRGTEADLVPTLAHQLSLNIPATKSHIAEAVRCNPLVFDLTLQDQINALIVGPLTAISGIASLADQPMIIVVDGLDECRQQDNAQRRVVDALISGLRQLPTSSRHKLFITSRPEHNIQAIFRKYDIELVRRMELDDRWDPDRDIWTFLNAGFADIRRHHPYFQGRRAHQIWPKPANVHELVRHSSGQFIYAATVLKYIKSDENYSPVDRLDAILSLGNNSDQPYRDLDALYEYIFRQVPDVNRILSFLSLQETVELICGKSYPTEILLQELLGEDSDRIRFRLRPLVSLLTWPQDCSAITFNHASLADFLRDRSRSNDLCTYSLSVCIYVVSRALCILTDNAAFQKLPRGILPGLVTILTFYADILPPEQRAPIWTLISNSYPLPNLLSRILIRDNLSLDNVLMYDISMHLDWILENSAHSTFPTSLLTRAQQLLVDLYQSAGVHEDLWPFYVALDHSRPPRPFSTDTLKLHVVLKICGVSRDDPTRRHVHLSRKTASLCGILRHRRTPQDLLGRHAITTERYEKAFRSTVYYLVRLPEYFLRAILVPGAFSNLDLIMRCSIRKQVQTIRTAFSHFLGHIPWTSELFFLAALVDPLAQALEVSGKTRYPHYFEINGHSFKAFRDKFPFVDDPTSVEYAQANAEAQKTLVGLGIKSSLRMVANDLPVTWRLEDVIPYAKILDGFRAIDRRA